MDSKKTPNKTTKKTTKPVVKNNMGYGGIYEAIAKFQYDCPILVKNSKGYGYNYTDLAEIMRAIIPLLQKHDLMILQPLSGSGIKTIIVHWPTNEQIEEFVEIPQDIALAKMNPYQAQGAGITYWRRYALCSYFGLVSDKDIDMGGNATPIRKKPYKPTISDNRFEEALLVIGQGHYTAAQLKHDFDLSKGQLEKLT